MSQPQASPPARRGSTVLGALLGVLCGVAVLAAVWTFVLDGGSAKPAPAPSRSPAPVLTRTPSAPAKPGPSRPAAAPSTPAPEQTPAPGSAVTQLQAGTLVVVMDSLPKASATYDQAVARAAQLSAGRSQVAVVVDSDAVAPTLNPGYWAVGVPGAATRAQADAICADFGLAVGGACYARPVK